MSDQDLTGQVIGAAIEVHRVLGPGLLESAYEECLCFELRRMDILFLRQRKLPVRYKEVQLDCGYIMDIVIPDRLVIELKTVEKLAPIHEAQLLTYLKLSKINLGLLLNFNVPLLKDGIKRLIL
jgi:GxxExxY protein